MRDIVKSVYCLTGSYSDVSATDFSHIEHTNRVFCKLDKNGDGYVTYTEFLDACKNVKKNPVNEPLNIYRALDNVYYSVTFFNQDESIVNSMKIFDEEDM